MWECWKSSQRSLQKGYMPLNSVICLVSAYHLLWLSRGQSSQAFGDLAVEDNNYRRYDLGIWEVEGEERCVFILYDE